MLPSGLHPLASWEMVSLSWRIQSPAPRHPKLGMYSFLSLPYQGHDFPSLTNSEDGSWVTGFG